MNAVLEVRDLTKHFGGVTAVDGLSFGLGAGEMVALIGPNGAGKSTCFAMLMGQLAPDRGSVRYRERELTGLSPRAIWAEGVGRTFQITQTFSSMTVRENVQTALIARHGESFGLLRRAGSRHVAAADALLELVGMGDQADRSVSVLAYGDLKRLELAIALAGEPELLLMDEPTAGMAPAERRAMMALVARIVEERGISVLFTEHDMEAVFAHADRILVLDRGQLIAEGAPDAIRQDAKVREVYLGSFAGGAGDA